MAHCPQCGNALPEKARFCGNCGHTIEQAPAQQPVRAVASKTMLGVPSPLAGAPPPQQQPPQQPAPQPAHPVAAKTMLGIPQQLPPHLQQPPQQQQPAHQVASQTMLGMPQQPAPQAPHAASKTMLGVAAPGIAPIQPPQQPLHQVAGKTMLGVAAPGIAPVHSQRQVQPLSPAELPPIVPAPPPLVDEPMPEPPPAPVRKGVPIAVVAAITAFILLVGGVAIALALRGGTPIVASPRVGPEGQDQLHLKCEGCNDGVVVHAGASSATFKAHEADLDLPTPLSVGDNPLELAIERAPGKSETVKLTVPVAYRVQPDLGKITAVPPELVVRVQAKPQSKVTIDNTAVTLDAQGSATHSIPLGDDARGAADEMKTFEREVAYQVEHEGKTDKGSVKARIPITPLRIDAPNAFSIVDKAPLMLTGRAAKGSTVVVDGKEIAIKPDGSFEAQLDVGADKDITVAAFVPKTGTGAPLGTRVATVKVQKVASLEDEAKRQDKELGLGYDAIASNVQGNVGQPFVVHGVVQDARSANKRTLLIVEDERGCSKGKCIARIVYGGDTPIGVGEYVRAYGKIAGTVAWNGSNVPDVEASFIVKGKR